MIAKKEMSRIDFTRELKGYVSGFSAYKIYNMISGYPESKKNIILDLLRSNPKKYVPYYLQDDI